MDLSIDLFSCELVVPSIFFSFSFFFSFSLFAWAGCIRHLFSYASFLNFSCFFFFFFFNGDYLLEKMDSALILMVLYFIWFVKIYSSK